MTPVNPRPPELELAEAEMCELRQLVANLRQERESLLTTHQDEITQRNSMVLAVREELERMQATKQTAVQQALAESTQEIGQLKAAVLAMREQLEQLQFEKQRAVQ